MAEKRKSVIAARFNFAKSVAKHAVNTTFNSAKAKYLPKITYLNPSYGKVESIARSQLSKFKNTAHFGVDLARDSIGVYRAKRSLKQIEALKKAQEASARKRRKK